MSPAIADGDWLLIDPTIDRWPRTGHGRRLPRAGRRHAGRQTRGGRSGRQGPVRRGLPRARRRRGVAAQRCPRPRRRPQRVSANRPIRASTARSRSSSWSAVPGSATPAPAVRPDPATTLSRQAASGRQAASVSPACGNPPRMPPASRASATSASGSRPPGRVRSWPARPGRRPEPGPPLASPRRGCRARSAGSRIAALGLAPGAHLGHPRDDLGGRQEDVVELVGVADRVAGRHARTVAADDDRDPRLLQPLRHVDRASDARVLAVKARLAATTSIIRMIRAAPGRALTASTRASEARSTCEGAAGGRGSRSSSAATVRA